MKQPKKLTRQQKEMVSGHSLNADEWMFVEELEYYIRIINKRTGATKLVDKFRRSSR